MTRMVIKIACNQYHLCLSILVGIAIVAALCMWARNSEPCPTVECPAPHAPFATVDDMRLLQHELVECRRDLDEMNP